MLTDIFAHRYRDVPMWSEIVPSDGQFLVQASRILNDQICPYYDSGGSERPEGKRFWKNIHDTISMELGLPELAQRSIAYQQMWQGKQTTQYYNPTFAKMCETFLTSPNHPTVSADAHMKNRLSLVEFGFRAREVELATRTQEMEEEIASPFFELPRRNAVTIPGSRAAGVRSFNRQLNQNFASAVEELNERMRRVGYKLNYHNGFIQRVTDDKLDQTIDQPFWALVADSKWKNVDTDMKEASDRRDTNQRDPAFYAMRALESSIKIISDQHLWSTGNEKGAHNYIDNLGSKRSGGFIAPWEVDALKLIFTHVRNPLGHGPGSEELPTLNPQQTDWIIESCMSWIRNLISRSNALTKANASR